MWVNEWTPTLSFVLYTINVECMCDASYVTWKYRQYRRYHVIFARKYKTLQNVNILGARIHSSGTSFFQFLLRPKHGILHKGHYHKGWLTEVHERSLCSETRNMQNVYMISQRGSIKLLIQSTLGLLHVWKGVIIMDV